MCIIDIFTLIYMLIYKYKRQKELSTILVDNVVNGHLFLIGRIFMKEHKIVAYQSQNTNTG